MTYLPEQPQMLKGTEGRRLFFLDKTKNSSLEDLSILVFCDAARHVKGLSSHDLSVAFFKGWGCLVRR